MRGQPGEDLVELLIGDAARNPRRRPSADTDPPVRCGRAPSDCGGHGARPPRRARSSGNGFNHRPRSGLQVEVVEAPQHRLRMNPNRRRQALVGPARTARQHHPAAEVPRFSTARHGSTPPRSPTRTGTSATGPSQTSGLSTASDHTPADPAGTPPPAPPDPQTHRAAGTAASGR